MKVILSSYEVKANGNYLGYYSQLYNGDWFASFTFNGMNYTRTAHRLDDLRELVRNAINNNEQ